MHHCPRRHRRGKKTGCFSGEFSVVSSHLSLSFDAESSLIYFFCEEKHYLRVVPVSCPLVKQNVEERKKEREKWYDQKGETASQSQHHSSSCCCCDVAVFLGRAYLEESFVRATVGMRRKRRRRGRRRRVGERRGGGGGAPKCDPRWTHSEEGIGFPLSLD